MKIINTIFLILIAAALFTGCDKVTPSTSKVVITPDTSTYIRKVLIEDYTGHICGNCPDAAYALDTIINLYGSQIVPIAVHAGSNAAVALPNYTTDFTCPVGDTWNTFFGVTANPNGAVNRSGIVDYSAWAVLTQAYLYASGAAVPASMNIKIANHYNTSTRTITDTLKCLYIQPQDSAYMLSVVITEDSVIDYQLFYHPNHHDDPTYVFNHVLRGSMNSAWGDTLSSTHQAAMTTFTKVYTLDLSTISKIKNDNNCHVVAFIYNAVTKQVVQAEEVWVNR